jgi:predicted acylesterase/phospholipase RssA/CRP-like cAMP-binding protein
MPIAARHPLFAGLRGEELDAIQSSMRSRQFEAQEIICRAGEPGDSLLLIESGLARVILEDRVVAKLRRGDVVGEMALVTGEPRSATVVAAVPTETLELRRQDFGALVARHPQLLANLNQILSQKLAETTARVGEPRARGEAVALIVGAAAKHLVPDILAAAESASPTPIASLEAGGSFEQALSALDDLVAEHSTVVVVADRGEERLPLLVDAADRAVALIAAEEEAELDGVGEVVTIDAADPSKVAWLGRHLTRTKLGLALGAGGAKGYAHIAAYRALEEAGYTVDYVAGSSIGAIIGGWIALGLASHEVEAAMRHAFRPEVVEDIFKLSLSGTSTGLETMKTVLSEATQGLAFEDLQLPLAVMTVDLNTRQPAPVTAGPLWEAMVAAIALAGIFPPFERNGQRLIDGLALVPVPTDSVVEAGADVTVAINIMSRETLPAWPGEVPPPTPEAGRQRMLDTLLEVMDLAQTDASERHAARADVVVTPLFGPASWRDFHLADLFLEAGRVAAEEQLRALRDLARPQS